MLLLLYVVIRVLSRLVMHRGPASSSRLLVLTLKRSLYNRCILLVAGLKWLLELRHVTKLPLAVRVPAMSPGTSTIVRASLVCERVGCLTYGRIVDVPSYDRRVRGCVMILRVVVVNVRVGQ